MLLRSADYWRRIGYELHTKRKYSASLQALESAREYEADNPDILCSIGIVLCDLGRYQEAEEVFGQVFSLGYSNPKAFAGLSLALNFQHKSIKAEQVAEDGLVCYPDDVQLKLRLATISETLCKYDNAMRVFKEALEADPDNVEALAGVARGYMRELRYAEAFHCLNKAIEKEGNIVPALCTMVSAYVQLQDAQKATEIIERIAEIDPEVAADFSQLVDESLFPEESPIPAVTTIQ